MSANFKKIMEALETVKLSKSEIELLYLRVEELRGHCHAPHFDKAYLSSTLGSRRTHSASENASANFLKHMERDPDYQVLLNIKKQMKVRSDLAELNQDLLTYPDDDELLAALQLKFEALALQACVITDKDELYLTIGDRLVIKMGESKVICQQGVPFYRKRTYDLLENLTSAGIQITLSSVNTDLEIIEHTLAHLVCPAIKDAVINEC